MIGVSTLEAKNWRSWINSKKCTFIYLCPYLITFTCLLFIYLSLKKRKIKKHTSSGSVVCSSQTALHNSDNITGSWKSLFVMCRAVACTDLWLAQLFGVINLIVWLTESGFLFCSTIWCIFHNKLIVFHHYRAKSIFPETTVSWLFLKIIQKDFFLLFVFFFAAINGGAHDHNLIRNWC